MPQRIISEGKLTGRKTGHSAFDKEQLSHVLGQVFVAQKTYGKPAEEIIALVNVFSLVLADYPMDDVIAAILKYIKRNPDVPSPSDIANIIDPPPEALSSVLYMEIRRKQRDNIYVTPEQRAFCQAYEQQELRKWSN